MGLTNKFWIIALAVLSGAVSIGRAENVSVLMEEGLYLEQTAGEPASAIKTYQKLIASEDATDDQKAQAMYRMGTCHLKLRETVTAIEVFNKVLADYPQSTSASQARSKLARVTSPDPAILMPADIDVYVEIGSPGKQVETIVEMLKGTPLAMQLQLNGSGGQINITNARSQTDYLSALLNPSMIEEFKKVRGLALGISNFTPNQPAPDIYVIFPGESDALRGLLTAMMMMQGKPVESIEGMQTLSTTTGADGTYACFDDNVIIVTTTRKQMIWSVKQYKGITQEPSLSTANKSFNAMTTKLGRRDDALTIWANPASIYEAAMPGISSPQMLIADKFVDFRGMNGLTVQLALSGDEITTDVTLSFRPGHHSIAYDLIRTPPITSAGFDGIPQNAIAVASFATSELGQNQFQAETIGNAITRLTGCDWDREYLNNIEQINLFVLPPEKTDSDTAMDLAFTPVINRLGISITSKDPARTSQVIQQLFRQWPPMLGEDVSASAEDIQGKIALGSWDGKDFYCYNSFAGRTNIIAYTPQVRDLALAVAADGGKSSARFNLDTLNGPDEISSLVYINLGGAIDAGAAILEATDDKDMMSEAQWNSIMKLAQLFGDTSFEYYTVEQPNLLKARFALKNLPPLAKLFPLVMQLNSSSRTAAPAGKITPIYAPPIRGPRVFSDVKRVNLEYLLALPQVAPAVSGENYAKSWTFETESDAAGLSNGRVFTGFAYTGEKSMQLLPDHATSVSTQAELKISDDSPCIIPTDPYLNFAYYSSRTTTMQFILEDTDGNIALNVVRLLGGGWQWVSMPISFDADDMVLVNDGEQSLGKITIKGGQIRKLNWAFIDDLSISNGVQASPRGRWRDINVAKPRKKPVTVDGSLDEWDELPLICTQPAQIVKNATLWKGPQDGSFKFAVAYDDEYLYVAARVIDDKIHPRPGDVAWRREYLSILLDARSKSDRLGDKENPLQHISLVAFGAAEPVIDTNSEYNIKNLTRGPDGTFVGQRHITRRPALTPWGGSPDEIILARLITETGYDVEAAIPISYIEALQGSPWKDFRLNMVLLDYDGGRTGDTYFGSMLYWRHDWRRPRNVPSAGTFIRGKAE